MEGTQWRMYKAMMKKEMEAINMRDATRVGDPMSQRNDRRSPSTRRRRGQDWDVRKEEGCLSPCIQCHSDPRAVSRVGDIQIWVQKWQE